MVSRSRRWWRSRRGRRICSRGKSARLREGIGDGLHCRAFGRSLIGEEGNLYSSLAGRGLPCEPWQTFPPPTTTQKARSHQTLDRFGMHQSESEQIDGYPCSLVSHGEERAGIVRGFCRLMEGRGGTSLLGPARGGSRVQEDD